MSGKHKRDRAAEHRAKQDAKEAKRITDAWTKSVESRGGVVHGDGVGQWLGSASAGEVAYLAVPPRDGKQVLVDVVARSADYGSHKYAGPSYSSVVEHMNASHIRFIESSDELDGLGFSSRSETYEQAQSLFAINMPDDANPREWFLDPGVDSPVFPRSNLDNWARAVLGPRRWRRMNITGVGTLRLGSRIIDRSMAGEAHFDASCSIHARALGNRHDFKRWARAELAPIVRVANDTAREMEAAGAVLELHLGMLYLEDNIAERRHITMLIAEARSARHDARVRLIRLLLEACTVSTALAWSRWQLGPNERGYEAAHSVFADIHRSTISYDIETRIPRSATIDHVSIAPGGGISVGYTVR